MTRMLIVLLCVSFMGCGSLSTTISVESSEQKIHKSGYKMPKIKSEVEYKVDF